MRQKYSRPKAQTAYFANIIPNILLLYILLLITLLLTLYAIRDWTSIHCLQLNADKTEDLIVAPENVAPMIRQSIGTLSSTAYSNLRNLGVIVEQSLPFNTHVKQLTRSCFFHLRNISELRSVAPNSELEMLLSHPVLTTVMYFVTHACKKCY